ncbi:MAG: glycosyltransferase family protein [Actinomycetota bacterium]
MKRGVAPAQAAIAARASRSEVLFLVYSPADLNFIDGSAIWVQSVAETLNEDTRLGIVIPLKARERRDVTTRLLKRLDRVSVLDLTWFRRGSRWVMTIDEAVDMLLWLDQQARFDVVLLRGFELCLEVVRREAFTGRLWSCYILEPERDATSPEHIAELEEVVRGSAKVVAQSQGMAMALEASVPEAAAKTVILPPAVDGSMVGGPLPPRNHRLIYTGKFAPLYPFLDLVEVFRRLRATYPDLEFEVAGDKFYSPPTDLGYADRVRSALMNTDGLIWYRGISRDEVGTLLLDGGIALNVWDRDHSPDMNDLVISTKTLDYCAAGLPVVLQRTTAQEEMLGASYPLFVSSTDEVLPLIERLLEDDELYARTAKMCRTAAEQFTYGNVCRALEAHIDAAAHP